MKNIGFIGLGNMGFEMIQNLSKANYNLIGYDINKSIYEELNAKNINTTNNIDEIFKICDVIITMLPDGDAVKKVYTENMSYVSKKSIMVDCSTIDVETTKYIHDTQKLGLCHLMRLCLEVFQEQNLHHSLWLVEMRQLSI